MIANETRDVGRTPSTHDSVFDGASIREVMRALRASGNPALGGDLVTQVTGERLEFSPIDGDPPRLEAAAPIEGDALVARPVADEPTASFGGFLDGIQNSRVIRHLPSGVPLVHGTVAAVIRVRTDQTLSTWQGAPRIERALFLPVSLAGDAVIATLQTAGIPWIDTLDGDVANSNRHPQELLGLARTAVQRRREVLETSLAESWCERETAPLFVDGGIAGSGVAARSDCAVGVVKSHRTLYASGDTVSVVTTLAKGTRTTGFEIRSPRRTAVASWYLRLRDSDGRDPFFGLVRVEIARDSFSTARADLVSRWILAERAPVALPDKRWSTMAYGIRDCEEYLRAVTG